MTLTALRAELVQQVADLRADLAAVMAASESSNADDEHDPEGATIAFERQQLAALLARAEQRLADVDVALASGGAVACERCGGDIGAERLEALPATRVCVRCAAQRN